MLLPLLLILLPVLALIEHSFASGLREPPVVATRYGWIRGAVDRIFPSTRVFLGIPYARPPVGPLRWAPPVPIEAGSGQWDAYPDDNALAHNSIETMPRGINSTGHDRVLNAWRFSAVCPQVEFYLHQNEDCLYLNIYTPLQRRPRRHDREPPGAGLPVLVYFFGGAFLLGSGSEHKIYDGSFIAENFDTVVVTLNFRLGVLGFLAADGLEGNYGIMDQQLALKWVQENIDRFGGDPKRVTIWGQSAGATSVAIHLTTPSSYSYFHKAIMQSAPLALKFRTQAEAMKLGKVFTAAAGCKQPRNGVASVECLRSKSALTLMALSVSAIFASGPKLIGNVLPWAPVVDGKLIKAQLLDSIASGHVRPDTAVLMGSLRDEASFLQWILDGVGATVSWPWRQLVPPEFGSRLRHKLSAFWYQKLLQLMFGDHSHKVLAQYPAHKRELISLSLFRQQQVADSENQVSTFQVESEFNWDQFYTLLSDYLFHCPARRVQSDLARLKTPVFAYAFNFQPDYLRDIGGVCARSHVCHAVDLPYVFHSTPQFITFSPAEQRVSDGMISYWTAFASGRHSAGTLWPDEAFNFSAQSPWRAFSKNSTAVMEITRSAWSIQQDYKSGTCDFWDELGYDF